MTGSRILYEQLLLVFLAMSGRDVDSKTRAVLISCTKVNHRKKADSIQPFTSLAVRSITRWKGQCFTSLTASIKAGFVTCSIRAALRLSNSGDDEMQSVILATLTNRISHSNKSKGQNQ